MSPSSETETSSARFVSSAERESFSGASPIIGMPSAVWSPTLAPMTSKRRGTMSIWTFWSFSERMRSSVSSWESFENAITTRSTSSARTIPLSCSGEPRMLRSPRPGWRSFGCASTKPTTFRPYSG